MYIQKDRSKLNWFSYKQHSKSVMHFGALIWVHCDREIPLLLVIEAKKTREGENYFFIDYFYSIV